MAAVLPHCPLDRSLLDVLVDSYEGSTDEEGRFVGEGKAVLRSGSTYQGSFVGGALQGFGKYVWSDGLAYEGDFVENTITGQGKYTWTGGAVYVGSVAGGLRHGIGTLSFEDSVVKYEGEWRSGRRHGKGTLTYDDNGTCVYSGSWKDDKRDGYGKLQYASGNTYEGEWDQDVKQDEGTMTWISGSIYSGSWKNNLPNGEGEQLWTLKASSPWPAKEGVHLQLPNRYVGSFKNGMRHGYGTFWYATGAQYVGQWWENMKHGRGRFTYEDGSVFEGYFEDDRPATTGPQMMPPTRHVTMEIQQLLVTECSDQGMVVEIENAVLDIMLRYNSELRSLYQGYIAGTTEQKRSQTITLPQFWIMLRDCSIPSTRLTIAEIDEMVQNVVKEKREPESTKHCPKNHLLFREFVEVLVHVAHRLNCHMPKLEDRVHALLTKHILGNVPRPGHPIKPKSPAVAALEGRLTSISAEDEEFNDLFESCLGSKEESACSLRSILKTLKAKGLIGEGTSVSIAAATTQILETLYPPSNVDSETAITATLTPSQIFSLGTLLIYPEFVACLDIVGGLRGQETNEMLA